MTADQINAEPAVEPEAPPPSPEAALLMVAGLVAVAGAVAIFVWMGTGFGYFWPGWAFLGGGAPLALSFALLITGEVPGTRRRALALHATVVAWGCGVLFLIWVLAGGGYFWPFFPAVILAGTVAAHAVVLRMSPGLEERELAERVDVLTRTRRGALDVQAAELRRIERDLHDGAQARLVALSMQLGRAEERLTDQPEVLDLVRGARLDAATAIAELRDLARGIAPPVLADRGLPAALEALGSRSAIPVEVRAELPDRALPVIEAAAYFVVAESLTNVAKHAGTAALVEASRSGDTLLLRISDEGPGGADPDGSGLSGLRSRVQALDGTLRIESPSGGGTIVMAELPCE